MTQEYVFKRKWNHNGWTYISEVEVKRDKRKVIHTIVNDSTRETITPDFTQYCFMSKIDFQNYIDLEFPDRGWRSRPLSSDDLRRMKNAGKKI